MFNFKNLSDSQPYEEDVYTPAQYRVSFEEFVEKRRTSMRPYVFDLRTQEEFDEGHLPGAYSLPFEHFEYSIYQMPYEGDILVYGGGNQEAERAGEILYENGFDHFFFIDSYEELLHHLKNAPFSVTEAAQDQIQQRLQNDTTLKGLRIHAKIISPKKARFSVAFVPVTAEVAKDFVIRVGEFDVYVDPDSLLYLEGCTVDLDAEQELGLSISNPDKEVQPLSGSAKEIMQQLLDEQINPMVAAHGGFIDLINIEDGRVYLEFGGGCKGCGMVDATLKQGVEVIVKEQIPDIVEILDVTDHANGTNPYFKPGK